MDFGRSFADSPTPNSFRGGYGSNGLPNYPLSSASPRSANNMTVTVQVRDLTLTLELGDGTQTFKWLAFTATNLYACHHPHLNGASNLTPINLTDSNGQALFPQEIICERIESGEALMLEVIGPRLGLTTPEFKRERPLWELYAFSPQTDTAATSASLSASSRTTLVPIVFLFDASELALNEPPGLFGNFNAWGVPLVMQWWRGNLYKYQMDFPAGSELVFKFVVGHNETILTPQIYPIIHDSQGNKLHYIKVAPIPPIGSLDVNYIPSVNGADSSGPISSSSSMLLDSTTKKKVFTLKEIIDLNQRAQTVYLMQQNLIRNGPELPVLSSRIVGVFPGGSNGRIRRDDRPLLERLFRRDWTEINKNIADIFPQMLPAPPSAQIISPTNQTAANRGLLINSPSPSTLNNLVPNKTYSTRLVELQQVLSKYHQELTAIFSYYSAGTTGLSPKNQHWNLLKWLGYLHLIKIPDYNTGAILGQTAQPPRATLVRLDKIYFQVLAHSRKGGVTGGGDLPMSQKEIKSSNNSLGKVLLHQENPFSIWNQMTRTEFLEALLRVAMLKYKNPTNLQDHLLQPPVEEKKSTDGTVPIPAIVGVGGVGGKDGKPAGPTHPTISNEPNPGLSFELLMRNHIIPYSVQSTQTSSINYSPPPVGHSPMNELRTRFITDKNIFIILEKYSEELQRLFKHYTGGAPASGLGLGLMAGLQNGGAPGSAGGIGIIGGLNGITNTNNLPPTLLGQSLSTDGLLNTLLPGGGGNRPNLSSAGSHHPNGSLKSSSLQPISSATIHLKELETMLYDYELLDPLLPRQRALANLGIALEGDSNEGGGVGGVGSSNAAGGSGAGGALEYETSLELLYPEFLELLIRIADTGTQWSNLYLEQQRLIEAAIAAGTLNPLDKPPASLLIASGGGSSTGLDDDDDLFNQRRLDDTELCERFLRLIQWLFPSEQEQRERRAKLAAQQQQQSMVVAPVVAPKVEEKKTEEKKEETKDVKGGKRGATTKTPVKPAPVKKIVAKK